MKVLMTADTVGGVWTYAVELMRSLEPCDIQFVLATMGRPLSEVQWKGVAVLPHVTVAESSYKLEWMDDPWDDVRASGEWLLELEATHEPDIVHLNGYAHAVLPFRAPVLVVGHSCVVSWWRAVKAEDAPAEWNAYRQAVRQGLHAADLVAAPTEAMLTELDSLYGPLPKERQVVLHNSRDSRLFPTDLPKEAMVFSAGRFWDEAKNVQALCAAAQQGLPWNVAIAGETTTPGNDQGEGCTADIPGVQLLGALAPEQVARWMGRAGIYALPAFYEPFGLSILEAALCGCALVLGDIPSLREIWGSDAALYVDPANSEALANAIMFLAQNDRERNRLAANAQVRALTRYTPERTAKAYHVAYTSLRKTNSTQASALDRPAEKVAL